MVTMDSLKAHLTPSEQAAILAGLGREPVEAEWALFVAMWNEHVSYKSSRHALSTLPRAGGRVRLGPGENAGVVDLWDGLAVALRIESHNHPSYIEPFQGAATGLGGIVRDIVATGAWPIAFMDSLCFGRTSHPRTAYLLDGVVRGIAAYGNCVGVPTVGGETRFDATYDTNCLVNVACVGLVRQDRVFHGQARRSGDAVIYLGAPTGPDGIQGAAMASATLDGDVDARLPAVQVADPFTGRRLIEACHELMKSDRIEGIQDMGAAGLTCSCVELADRSGMGMTVDLDQVPLTDPGLTCAEILLSETQERMLLTVPFGAEAPVLELAGRAGLAAAVIGHTTPDRQIRLFRAGRVVAEVPVDTLASGVPEPPWVRHRSATQTESDAPDDPVPSCQPPCGPALFDDPNLRSRRFVYEQYDHMVQLRTVLRPGEGDAAVLRIAEHAPRGLAMTLQGGACRRDPEQDAFDLVARAVLNLACVGARPLGMSDGLNAGNPERGGVLNAFEAALQGLARGALTFNCPITGGNVSFYNESDGRGIDLTPVLLVVGEIADVSRVARSGFEAEGDTVALAEGTSEAVPVFLVRAIEAGLLRTAHDVSEGGLLATLAQCCVRSRHALGACMDGSEVASLEAHPRVADWARVIVAGDPAGWSGVRELAAAQGVTLRPLGKVVAEVFNVFPRVCCTVDELLRDFAQPML